MTPVGSKRWAFDEHLTDDEDDVEVGVFVFIRQIFIGRPGVLLSVQNAGVNVEVYTGWGGGG
jgi:hypothetical protein